MPVTRALVAKRWGSCPVATLAAASLLLIMPPPMCTFCFRALTFCFFCFRAFSWCGMDLLYDLKEGSR
jgi:hypothetical protein